MNKMPKYSQNTKRVNMIILCFVMLIIGGFNWLSIGLLQYDFVAGMFGFQASIFSRLCYILVGVAAVYLILRIIVNKGTFKIYERKKKKNDDAERQGSHN